MMKAVVASLVVGLFLLGLSAGVVAGYFYATNSFQALPAMQWKQTDDSTGPVARVRVTTIATGRIESSIVSYGTVETIPSAVETFSVPFESQIERVLVVKGQPIAVGDKLIQLKPSPESLYLLQSARAELAAVQRDLEQVQQRVTLNLATQPEFVQAQSAVDAAQLRVASIEQRGIETTTSIVADSSGMVYAIPTEQGQLVPAGAPIIETSPRNRVQAVIGVEPGDVQHLNVGEDVVIRPVDGASAAQIHGKISLITGDVDPATRLVMVYVALDEPTALRLNQYVTAEMNVESTNALIVPRSAVLPAQGSWFVFTVNDGAAKRHQVNVGIEHGDQVEVFGDSISANDQIVTVGNAVLEDGMRVEIQP